MEEWTPMKCLECGTKMTSRRANHRADDLGLPGVVLCNIEILDCPECGEEEVVIPRLEELNSTLAAGLVRKAGRLAPTEIRFLRKCLGWSGAVFAKRMGVTRETVSRWETGKEKIGPVADRLLRVSVVHWKPIEDYAQEDLEWLARREPAQAARKKYAFRRNNWAPATVPARKPS
jgi:putative zinc finger/helix-turn-helix YgiT family protein